MINIAEYNLALKELNFRIDPKEKEFFTFRFD